MQVFLFVPYVLVAAVLFLVVWCLAIDAVKTRLALRIISLSGWFRHSKAWNCLGSHKQKLNSLYDLCPTSNYKQFCRCAYTDTWLMLVRLGGFTIEPKRDQTGAVVQNRNGDVTVNVLDGSKSVIAVTSNASTQDLLIDLLNELEKQEKKSCKIILPKAFVRELIDWTEGD